LDIDSCTLTVQSLITQLVSEVSLGLEGSETRLFPEAPDFLPSVLAVVTRLGCPAPANLVGAIDFLLVELQALRMITHKRRPAPVAASAASATMDVDAQLQVCVCVFFFYFFFLLFFFLYIYMLHTRSTCLFTEIVPDAHYAPPEGLLAAGLGASGGAFFFFIFHFFL
jgi:hypothetical protein